MSAQRLRDAAKVLRQRADAVRRPFSQQERLHYAVAEWLDAAAREEDAFECGDIYPRTVADLILGADS